MQKIYISVYALVGCISHNKCIRILIIIVGFDALLISICTAVNDLYFNLK